MHVLTRPGRSLLLCLAALASCSGDSGPTGTNIIDDAVSRVVVTPSTLQLAKGLNGQFTAVAMNAANAVLAGRSVTWSSGNTAVATVAGSGVVTTVGPGTTTISAVVDGKTGTAQLTVLAAPGGAPVRMELTPTTVNLQAGASAQLQALAYDAQNLVTTLQPYVWTSSNTSVATVSANGMVTGVAQGSSTIRVSSGAVSAQATVTVTSSAPAGNVIDVNPGLQYQTISGWQGHGQNGWFDCNSTAYGIYRNQLNDRLVNELGINRVSIALQSGMENIRDYHAEYAAGLIDRQTYTNSWFVPVNDNNDPFVADLTKFHWAFLDGYVEHSILPMRQRLQARGEKLYFVLQYVDFIKGLPKPFAQMSQPEEYAEFVVTAFRHLQSKYGFVPDALEMVLEPEHTPYFPADIGRAMVATANRLQAAGFTPAFIAPSTTSMANASTWYDQMLQVNGVRNLIDELSYHRYVAVSPAALQAIGTRSSRDGVKTSMLEHIGSGFDDLYQDLTVANVSAWEQFTLAFCGNRDNPDNAGAYYQINQTDPSNPKINITNHSRLLRQVFAYVRSGAVRIGAVSGNATSLLPLAFRNANGKQVVVVQARAGTSFSVRGLAAGRYGINYGTTVGNEWNVDLADQTISSGGTIQATIPRAGVLTIYAR
jgi:hypothetical protein